MKLLVLLLTIPFIAIANDKKEDPNAKKYSEAEFKEAVAKQVEKNMRRLGRTSIIDFSKELMKKEKILKSQELKFAKREESLKIIRDQIDKKLKNIDQKQNSIISCLDQRDKDKKKRVGHMVDVVAGMRPVNAASVLSVQDSDIAVHILGLLDPVKVSKIFNLMDKEISARLQKQYMTMKK